MSVKLNIPILETWSIPKSNITLSYMNQTWELLTPQSSSYCTHSYYGIRKLSTTLWTTFLALEVIELNLKTHCEQHSQFKNTLVTFPEAIKMDGTFGNGDLTVKFVVLLQMEEGNFLQVGSLQLWETLNGSR